jgi:NAD(P)-dependent dehydrogenase (short-subunit alcohol dehydrogenase family)
VNPQTVEQTAALAGTGAPASVRVSGHRCDVSDESQVLRFRDELQAEHATDHVDLVFSNAGIGGGGSFVNDSRQEWERTFAVDWWGVYYCARAFLPLLIASGDGVLVNTSSLNGLWASLGPGIPNNAYSTAKFAVRGFTEALIEDLRTNAPQVRAAVVLPGSVGTDIIANTRRAHQHPEPRQMTDAQLRELIPAEAKARLIRAGALTGDAPPRTCDSSWHGRKPSSATRRRSARPPRPSPFSKGSSQAPGGFSSARTPPRLTRQSAPSPRPPMTTPP